MDVDGGFGLYYAEGEDARAPVKAFGYVLAKHSRLMCMGEQRESHATLVSPFEIGKKCDERVECG